jgi:hypothetical protein
VTRVVEDRQWPFLPDVTVKNELVFCTAEEGINVAETVRGSVKVKVREPFRVVHEGKAYSGGDVLEVPSDDTTELWLKAKWVEPVPQKASK